MSKSAGLAAHSLSVSVSVLRKPVLVLTSLLMLLPLFARADDFVLNDQDYFEKRSLDVLVFSNWYDAFFSDSKISGVELIHFGERNATNGDVRLNITPEQWDPIAEFKRRDVDKKHNRISAYERYSKYSFDYSVQVEAHGDKISIAVILPKALPKELEGKAGFNLEFLPATYFEKSFIADNSYGYFPIYPSGVKEQNGVSEPTPMAEGNSLTLAPEDPRARVSIVSKKQKLRLYDGRGKAQNGWFVVRSEIPAHKSGKVIEWELQAGTDPHWTRPPMIAHSQVGYHPEQKKVAVIELDKHDAQTGDAKLFRVQADGSSKQVFEATTSFWGKYQRYLYSEFDFSSVKDEGVYFIDYKGQKSDTFRIAKNVYDSAWYPTLDVYMPVQMDHMMVNEAYRVWHGVSHMDDARQAPVNHEHFDLYAQGPTTDTPYKSGEHIPGLNVGGWFDAGDYDIRTQTQYGTVLMLVQAWEKFGIKRDVTKVDYAAKYVDLHVPDGKNDILQQIEHGTLALISQYRAVGHAINGIIAPSLDQYTHLGDASTKTDGLIYNPALGVNEQKNGESGKPDDRWAFTSRSSALDYGSIAALAAASRALAEENPALAKECRETALRVWHDEQSHKPDVFEHGNTTGGPLPAEKLRAAVELLITTGDKEYKDAILELLPQLEPQFGWHAMNLLRAMPYMDKAYADKMRELSTQYVAFQKSLEKQNPFGVLIVDGGWAGDGWIINMGVTNYYVHEAFPDLLGAEYVYKDLNYIYGTHPDSSISFVSNVGTRSKKVAYGNNRADFSFISGGIVPGILLLKPDYPENKENWPFLWGENEYVVNLAANYIFLVNAVDSLVKE